MKFVICKINALNLVNSKILSFGKVLTKHLWYAHEHTETAPPYLIVLGTLEVGIYEYLNSLPNDKFLDLSKIECNNFAADKINVTEKFWDEQKALWEKKKILSTRIFSFSHNVFKRVIFQGRKKPVPHNSKFLTTLTKTAFENILKGRKCWSTDFSVTFILSSASALNLDQSKILLLGKELILCLWLLFHLVLQHVKKFLVHCAARIKCIEDNQLVIFDIENIARGRIVRC